MTTQPHLCLAHEFYLQAVVSPGNYRVPVGTVVSGTSRSMTYRFPDGSEFRDSRGRLSCYGTDGKRCASHNHQQRRGVDA